MSDPASGHILRLARDAEGYAVLIAQLERRETAQAFALQTIRDLVGGAPHTGARFDGDAADVVAEVRALVGTVRSFQELLPQKPTMPPPQTELETFHAAVDAVKLEYVPPADASATADARADGTSEFLTIHVDGEIQEYSVREALASGAVELNEDGELVVCEAKVRSDIARTKRQSGEGERLEP